MVMVSFMFTDICEGSQNGEHKFVLTMANYVGRYYLGGDGGEILELHLPVPPQHGGLHKKSRFGFQLCMKYDGGINNYAMTPRIRPTMTYIIQSGFSSMIIMADLSQGWKFHLCIG
jgi:hypothetical protein